MKKTLYISLHAKNWEVNVQMLPHIKPPSILNAIMLGRWFNASLLSNGLLSAYQDFDVGDCANIPPPTHLKRGSSRNNVQLAFSTCVSWLLMLFKWSQIATILFSPIPDTFHFTSKRHHGFPFSLTFYLNGMQVGRLSSCCEYKHRKGTRLGGKHGHFGFVNVERSSPCYRYGKLAVLHLIL